MKKVNKIIRNVQKKTIRQTRMFCRALKVYRQQTPRLYKREKKRMLKKWNYSLLKFQRAGLKKIRQTRYFLSAWRGQIRQSFYVGEKRLNVLNLTLLVCMFLISGISFTGAYFSDDEISTDNHWQMAKLEINSSGSNFVPLVSHTQTATTSVDVVNDGNLKLKYTTTVQNVGGDLCSYLDMRIYASSSQIFSGTLSNGTILPDTTLVSSSIGQYDFETILTSDNENLQNKNCSFDLIFKSWQDELPNSTSGGYTDETSVHLIVNSGDWEDEEVPAGGCMKINEVYYDPDSSHGDGNDEWIELYNACSEEVNLKDWYLKDNHDTEIIHQNYPIAPGGFVLLAANASLWNTYWSIVPTNAVKISLGSGQSMFNNLANDGDRVELYNASSTLVDAMSYGDDISYFSLPEPSPLNAKGRSISRKIKGVDTDLADDWQYLLIPTPYSE